MKVHFYDKDTFEYTCTREAELDPLESQLAGKAIYVLPANATFIELPRLKNNEVAIFNKKIGAWVTKLSYKGQYKVNINTGAVTEIKDTALLKPDEVLMTKDQYNQWVEDPLQFEIINRKLVNIANTQQYQTKYNIKKYEQLIKQAKEDYDKVMSTPVQFTNGLYYLPRYADDFAKLATKKFPQEIWDASGINSKLMSSSEFLALKSFIEGIADRAYKNKKLTIKKYTLEINKLKGE
jgi:hypothetical protein